MDDKRATALHHTLAQVLFAIPRAQKDIQTTVYFLITRVKIPDEDDLGKLKRVLRYVRRTINLLIIVRTDSLAVIKWLVYTSYAAHPDMIRHTGSIMSLGRGSVTGIAK